MWSFSFPMFYVNGGFSCGVSHSSCSRVAAYGGEMFDISCSLLTSETRKSDTTGSRMPSVRTLTPHFNTPPQRKILIYHPHTTTMPQVKARAAKDEESEEKIRMAL